MPEIAPHCTDPTGRRLLFRYSSRAASEFEQRAFERHILECDRCYEDFLAVWRVSELVETWPDDDSRPEAEDAPGPELDSGSREVLPNAPARGGVRVVWPLVVATILGLLCGILVGLSI